MTSPPLRVGVDLAPPPPMCFGVPGAPDFVGFEVDLLHALCARLGRELRAGAWLWADLLDKLQDDEIDLICTAVTVTPERRTRYRFSEPYLDMGLAIVCRQADPVTALTPGAVRRVGARIGTPAERAARAAGFDDLVTFHYNDEAYRALDDRLVDAIADDWPIGAWFAAQSPARTVGARLPGTESHYAFVLRPGDGLAGEIDDGLRATFGDGTYAAAYAKWMAPIVGDTCDVRRAGTGQRPVP